MPGTHAQLGAEQAHVHYYGSEQLHDTHEHDSAHLSVLLAGEFEESAGRATVEAFSGSLRLRPDGFRHAVRFGRPGALILTLAAPTPDEREDAAQQTWLPMLRAPSREVLRNLFAGVACDAATAAVELLALVRPHECGAGGASWLRHARERIADDPASAEMGAMAHEAGVHRVYFARAFASRFGAPPSVLRRRAMLDHALAAIVTQRRSLADAAASAGFADQSHMTRAFSEFLGVAPARLRALLR